MYACTAPTEEGARCRHWATEGDADQFCAQHAGMRNSGRTVEKVLPPDCVEYKFNVNSKWAEELMKLGVELREQDFQAKEQKHFEHAQQYGREAYRFRKDIVDSGVPVFGPDGLVSVSVYELFRELVSAYEIVDIFLRPTKPGGNPRMKVLVVYFSHGEEQKNTEAIEKLLEFLASSCWGHCHVWANPPGSTGKVKATVNISHREPEKTPAMILQFANGLFAVEEVAS